MSIGIFVGSLKEKIKGVCKTKGIFIVAFREELRGVIWLNISQ